MNPNQDPSHVQPSPRYKRSIARFACKAKDLVKTIRFMAAGIGAVWELDASDVDIYTTDRTGCRGSGCSHATELLDASKSIRDIGWS